MLLVATSACVTALRRLSEAAPDAALDAEAPGGVMALAKEVLKKHADRADDAALTQPRRELLEALWRLSRHDRDTRAASQLLNTRCRHLRAAGTK